jgi:hypothetical protein
MNADKRVDTKRFDFLIKLGLKLEEVCGRIGMNQEELDALVTETGEGCLEEMLCKLKVLPKPVPIVLPAKEHFASCGSRPSLSDVTLADLGLKGLQRDRLLCSLEGVSYLVWDDGVWPDPHFAMYRDDVSASHLAKRIDALLLSGSLCYWDYSAYSSLYPVRGKMFGRDNAFNEFCRALEVRGFTRADWMCLSSYTVTPDVLLRTVMEKGIDTPLLLLASVAGVSQTFLDRLCHMVLWEVRGSEFTRSFRSTFGERRQDIRYFVPQLSVRDWLVVRSIIDREGYRRFSSRYFESSDHSISLEKLRWLTRELGFTYEVSRAS